MTNGFLPEIERIKKEYARRRKKIAPDFYSLKNPANRFMILKRKDAVSRLLKKSGQFPLTGLKILEVGCGKGDWFTDFEEWGALEKDLSGVEILPDRLAEAAARFPSADLKLGSGSDLPWPAGTFSLVLQATVFSSILETKLRQHLAEEMFRVLKPGGFILWYDFSFNNPWNCHVKGVRAEEVRRLFPAADISMEKITLAPPVTRMLAGFAPGLCSLLERAVFLNTHLLVILRKKT